MKGIGLDIGTTSLCAVVLETETGKVLETLNLLNDTFADTGRDWEKVQDPLRIETICNAMLEELLIRHPDVCAIGVTGQMHGIVYLDREGNPVSPLYTWQDGRGDLLWREGRSYADILSQQTGYRLATGFGCVTHVYQTANGLVPADAATFCTIQDYIAMRFAGKTRPLLHPSDAASLGLFCLEKSSFDLCAAEKAGIDPTMLPAVQADSLIGTTAQGIPVALAIGDNQASFIGSVRDVQNSILINVGTGSQIVITADRPMDCCGIETRPFLEGRYLLVGSSLCGGRAYALLEQFFRRIMEMSGSHCESCYPMMDRYLAEYPPNGPPLVVSTLFSGTREDPSVRGSISNIGVDNFRPEHLMTGVMAGMGRELYDMYETMQSCLAGPPSYLIGSGNGLRKNIHLRKKMEELFGLPMYIPVHCEEAAYGAALFAVTVSGHVFSLNELQKKITYQLRG